MYEKDGEKYFIVDSHVALWDAREQNRKNIHGKQFIDCFYDYHMNLSPDEVKWGYDEYCYYGGERLVKDLFDDGYVDHAIFQPALLGDFYVNGFGQTEEAWALVQKNPDRLTYNHAYDPRNGEEGLAQLKRDAERFGLKGVKLYTAEWHGDSRGYKLDDPWSYRYLEACQELGIKNIHVHKGPTIRPLDRDAFDVADVDKAATDFVDLTFIVEHCGLPRLEDFCWIATQETNVHAGLAVVMPFIHTRPRYFAQVLGELLYWIGEDKINFASDYAIWTPKWLIERFVDFQIPEDLTEYGPITVDQKKKILGLNAARLYDIDVPAELRVAGDGAGDSNTAMEATSTASDARAAQLEPTPS
jgi:predicted TIM-barrel fold metal-dependent hydrolase